VGLMVHWRQSSRGVMADKWARAQRRDKTMREKSMRAQALSRRGS
jgi:hypothetical protein